MRRWLSCCMLLCIQALVYGAADPADITFVAIDFKLSRDHGIQVCEVQPTSLSKFQGYDWAEKGVGLTGQAFVEVMDEYVDTVYYRYKDVCEDRFLPIFHGAGWHGFSTLTGLKKSEQWLELAKQEPADPSDTRSYAAALYVRARTMGDLSLFKRNYPGILVLDAAIMHLHWDKAAMTRLFDEDEQLSKFKPAWVSYPKVYKHDLHKRIKKRLKADLLVIKPVAGTKGRGVIIIPRAELNTTLALILKNPEKLAKHPDESYSWWAQDKSDNFIVEDFAVGDSVSLPEYDGREFDPTMRTGVVMVHSRGETELHFLEWHWHVPVMSLDEEGSYNQLHKGMPFMYRCPTTRRTILSAAVAQEHRDRAEEQLRKMLPLLYQRMRETSGVF